MSAPEDLTAKAERFIRTAEFALKDGDYDSCVSRCYYAMFFVAEALLAKNGLTSSSHKGVISLFGSRFIKPGVVQPELGKALRKAFDLRQKGDYSTGLVVTRDEAKTCLDSARDFISSVEHLLG
ncbi:MAG: HEPN domain-containing protein [Actinomycetota bacterium]